MRARRLFPLLLAIAALLACGIALARPGGGGGYSGGGGGGGGGGGSSGGGGGDDSGIVFLLISLCIDHPAIGIPLILLFIGFTVVRTMMRGSRNDWSTAVARSARYSGAEMQPNVRAARTFGARRGVEELRTSDPNFSVVLFEDFLYALYAEVQVSRGRGQIARLSPYLGPPVVTLLAASQGGGVSDVIVGAMQFRPAPLHRGDVEDYVVAEFDANYTEARRSWFVRERWTLARRRGVLSRTPDRVRVFACPSCGAPLDVVVAGVCSYCKQQVSSGAFDWVVREVQVLEREPKKSILLGDAPEQGTTRPTIVDPEASARIRQLGAKDPSFAWDAFQRRVGLVFAEFQVAWAARDLTKMRPFMSDALFATQQYWIEAFKQQGLRNVTQNARITGLELARVTSDRFYDALTVRLWATGLDFTLRDADGAVVGGSRSRERPYSEYWTFIRGSARTGPTRTDPVCPSCGAPLRINMSGSCEYCKAKVTSGDFDWVLSRIEQDESYEG